MTHPGGRLDASVIIEDTKTIRTAVFKHEKDFCAWIVSNMDKFCTDILNDELVSFEIERNMAPLQNRCLSPRPKRVDLLIQGTGQTYLVELKNPYHKAENRKAIGQLLDYGRSFVKPAQLVLVTTNFDLDTAKTIEHYNLPIRYIYLSKEKMLEYVGDLDD